MVSERSGEAGVTVTVFSVKGGAKVTLITRRTADGKVYVTVQGGGEIGLEFGPPAGGEVTLDTGSDSTTEGANAKGGVKAVGNGSVTWVFPNEDKAHEFAQIVANKARDAALDTNPITGIGRRIIGVGEDLVAMWAPDAGYDTGDPSRTGARHRLVMAPSGGWTFERTEPPA